MTKVCSAASANPLSGFLVAHVHSESILHVKCLSLAFVCQKSPGNKVQTDKLVTKLDASAIKISLNPFRSGETKLSPITF
jgi:hypothetical protein